MHPVPALAPLLVLGAGLACGAAHAAETPGPLWIDQIPVVPGGNLIYADGRVELHPKALLGAGYDSNIDATRDEPDGDGYVRGLAGVQVEWLPAVADRVSVDAQVEGRRYAERQDRDFTGGRLQVGWTRESALGPLAALAGGVLLADDPLIETGRQVLRSRYDVDAAWWLRGVLQNVRLGCHGVAEDYLEDAGVFDAEERDYLRPRLSAEWRYGRQDAPTVLGLRLELDRIAYQEDDSPYQDGTGVALSALVDHHLAPQLLLTGTLGVEHRRHADAFAGDAAYGDATMTRPIGQLLLRWDAEEYSRLDLGVASQVVPTIDANAAYLLQGWLHARWRLRRSCGVVGQGDVYDLQRSGSASGDNPHEVTLRLRAGVELWARDALVIRAMAGSESGDPGGDGRYQRFLGTLDAAMAW